MQLVITLHMANPAIHACPEHTVLLVQVDVHLVIMESSQVQLLQAVIRVAPDNCLLHTKRVPL